MQLLNGKTIANNILANLKQDITARGIIPGLAVILIGMDPASVSYVAIKEKRAKEIGMHFEKHAFPETATFDDVARTILSLNQRTDIHGIIIQLPIPEELYQRNLYHLVDPAKDVDGFHPETRFDAPIALGVWHLLESTGKNLADLSYAVVGKGMTAGGPIIRFLQTKGLKPFVVDSITSNPAVITAQADVLISTVGKPGLITAEYIKQGAILIDAGIVRVAGGALAGDIDPQAAREKAGWYTPVPGGVGPMTVAYLLRNTFTAAQSAH